MDLTVERKIVIRYPSNNLTFLDLDTLELLLYTYLTDLIFKISNFMLGPNDKMKRN